MSEKEFYTVSEVADLLDIQPRSVQIRCKTKGLEKIDGQYQIPADTVSFWVRRKEKILTSAERLQEMNVRMKERIDNADNELDQETEEMLTEYFTPDEYDEFKKRLTEYPLQRQIINQLTEQLQDYRNQVNYLQKSIDKQREQMDVVLDAIHKQTESIKASLQAIQQQNFIEAKKQGFDVENGWKTVVKKFDP